GSASRETRRRRGFPRVGITSRLSFSAQRTALRTDRQADSNGVFGCFTQLRRRPSVDSTFLGRRSVATTVVLRNTGLGWRRCPLGLARGYFAEPPTPAASDGNRTEGGPRTG